MIKFDTLQGSVVKEICPMEDSKKTVTSIKGFDLNFKCLEFQFEVGKHYEVDGPIRLFESRFHGVVGNPIHVFEHVIDFNK